MIFTMLKIVLTLLMIIRGFFVVNGIALNIIALDDLPSYQKRLLDKYKKTYSLNTLKSSIEKKQKRYTIEGIILVVLILTMVII